MKDELLLVVDVQLMELTDYDESSSEEFLFPTPYSKGSQLEMDVDFRLGIDFPFRNSVWRYNDGFSRESLCFGPVGGEVEPNSWNYSFRKLWQLPLLLRLWILGRTLETESESVYRNLFENFIHGAHKFRKIFKYNVCFYHNVLQKLMKTCEAKIVVVPCVLILSSSS